MILASRVIDTARDRRATFDRKRHPDTPALRYLSDYHRDLFGKVAIRNPAMVQTTLQIPFPFVDEAGAATPFADGYVLPAHKSVRPDGVVTFSTPHRPQETPLAVMAPENRLIQRLKYSALVEGGRLYLVGTEDETWEHVERIDIHYTPEPVDLLALEDALLIPDGGYLACVEAVAAFFGVRSDPPVELSRRATEAEDRFLAEITMARPARRIPKYRRKW